MREGGEKRRELEKREKGREEERAGRRGEGVRREEEEGQEREGEGERGGGGEKKTQLLTSLKLIIISLESSMSLNIPSSLLVNLGPHPEGKQGREKVTTQHCSAKTHTHTHTHTVSENLMSAYLVM